MAVKHYNVLCNGSSQELLGLAVNATAERGGKDDPSFATLVFQAGAANAGPVFIGETGSTVANTNCGFAVINGIMATVVQAAGGSALRLSDFAIKGTNGERLAILGVLR